jgi:multidrug resistance protein, MATE family
VHSVYSLIMSSPKSELRSTLKIAIPLIFGQIGQTLMNLTDSMMVGPLGAAPLAASAFVNNVFNIPLVVLIGLSTCISVKVSRAYGAQDAEKIRRFFWHGLILCVLAGLLVTFALLAASPVLIYLGQPPEVMAIAGPFYLTIIISLVPVMVFQAGKMYCDAFSHTTPASIILLVGLLLNIFANWVLIYGNLGFPALGLTGSGIGTLFCRSLTAFLMMLYIFRAPIYQKYVHAIWRVKLQIKTFKEMLAVGIPAGMQYLFEVGAFAGAGIMVGWVSTVALAAHQIALSVASLTFMVAMGLSYAASVRVGQAAGRDDHLAIRRIGQSALIFIIGVETIFSVGFILLRHWVPTLYIKDAAVVTVAAQLFIVAAVFQIFDGVQTVAAGILRGLADVNIPTGITFFSYWIVGLPLAAFLGFYVKLNQLGIWIGLALSLVFAAVLLVWRFWRLTHISKHSHSR